MQIIRGKKEDLNEKMVDIFLAKVSAVLKKKEVCVVGVPGGRSIVGFYQALRARQTDFGRIIFMAVDERIVPVDDPDRNYNIMFREFLEPLAFDGHDVNVIPFTNDDSEEDYTEALMDLGGKFDIMIFGVGEDGHIASLFPNHEILDEEYHGYLYIDDSPKLPKERVTVSRSVIENCDFSILIFFGEEKKKALDDFLGETPENQCPAKITLKSKDVFIFVD